MHKSQTITSCSCRVISSETLGHDHIPLGFAIIFALLPLSLTPIMSHELTVMQTDLLVWTQVPSMLCFQLQSSDQTF